MDKKSSVFVNTFLHYDIRVTPGVHCRAGFKYDSTLGFNDNIGFRFGTSYPWQLYDLRREETLPIIELPLIIQDGAMLDPSKGMRLDEDMAFQYVELMTQAVESVGGVLTLLWHPHVIIDAKWWRLYLKTLDYLKTKNAWFGSVKEIIITYFYGESNQTVYTPLAAMLIYRLDDCCQPAGQVLSGILCFLKELSIETTGSLSDCHNW